VASGPQVSLPLLEASLSSSEPSCLLSASPSPRKNLQLTQWLSPWLHQHHKPVWCRILTASKTEPHKASRQHRNTSSPPANNHTANPRPPNNHSANNTSSPTANNNNHTANPTHSANNPSSSTANNPSANNNSRCVDGNILVMPSRGPRCEQKTTEIQFATFGVHSLL